MYRLPDADYQTSLIVANIDTLRERREVLTAKFSKRQVLASSSLLHSLQPDRRNNDITNSLRNAKPFYSFRTRTKDSANHFYRTVSITIHNYQWFDNVSINFQAQLRVYFYVLSLICIFHILYFAWLFTLCQLVTNPASWLPECNKCDLIWNLNWSCSMSLTILIPLSNNSVLLRLTLKPWVSIRFRRNDLSAAYITSSHDNSSDNIYCPLTWRDVRAGRAGIRRLRKLRWTGARPRIKHHHSITRVAYDGKDRECVPQRHSGWTRRRLNWHHCGQIEFVFTHNLTIDLLEVNDCAPASRNLLFLLTRTSHVTANSWRHSIQLSSKVP